MSVHKRQYSGSSFLLILRWQYCISWKTEKLAETDDDKKAAKLEKKIAKLEAKIDKREAKIDEIDGGRSDNYYSNEPTDGDFGVD